LNSTPTATASLTFTGERFTPENRGAIWYEHWHRYCVAAPLARGRIVLDAACGEGYGSALLARGAATVIGIDIGAEAIAHAQARYVAPNLSYVLASVTDIPLGDGTVDMIVSFETIEHLAAQRQMLAEFRRVLAPAGVLVISSPNRPVYNEGGEVANAFHVRELDRAELKALLDPGFPHQAWHAQRVVAHSALWAEGHSGDGIASFDVLTADGPQRRDAPAGPMYFVVLCAADGVALPPLPALSLFDDDALSLWREFARMARRERQLIWDEIDARTIAEERHAELIEAMKSLASERQEAAAARVQHAAVQEVLAKTQSDLARETRAHGETRARLAYRETLPGWLRWPLGVARRRLAARQP
jgi:SAM-dependent methyltransferase